MVPLYSMLPSLLTWFIKETPGGLFPQQSFHVVSQDRPSHSLSSKATLHLGSRREGSGKAWVAIFIREPGIGPGLWPGDSVISYMWPDVHSCGRRGMCWTQEKGHRVQGQSRHQASVWAPRPSPDRREPSSATFQLLLRA